MTDTAELPPEPGGWLSNRELQYVRQEIPLVYVNIVPVRLANNGQVAEVGLLLRADDGVFSRALIAGRVLYHETIRSALTRHIAKDLGQLAMPQIPVSPTPFTVAEYFPTPGASSFYDPRQHAVALAYVIPVQGECAPSQNALDIGWFSPEEAASPETAAEMIGGQDVLLRQALAFCGVLP